VKGSAIAVAQSHKGARPMIKNLRVSGNGATFRMVAVIALLSLGTALAQNSPRRIALDKPVILIDSSEASYVQYAAKDLGAYLAEITGELVTVSSTPSAGRNAKSIIAIGEKMALSLGVDLGSMSDLGDEGSVIRAFDKGGVRFVVVAGGNPHGTNMGAATFMQMVRSEGKTAYVEGPLNLRSKPNTAVRGFHVNGWSLNYPYAFRAWREADWKHFIDLAWAQRSNLVFFWPFVEIMPLPLSAEDEAYLQEVHRVIEYAQKQRGLEVWIMQSANRVAMTDCGVRDPRARPYWVNNCQKDMNPADPRQFANIEKEFEVFYRNINNADGFCMIDSDPGGWPQSPLSDQAKIFNAARRLLDQYNVKGKNAKLVDWMWIGWGRHKYFTASERLVTGFDWTEKNPDEGDLEFMADTMRNFQQHLAEPWDMIAGMTPYLESSKRASTLNKTIYLPYGAVEMEPAFPWTNVSLGPVREALDKAAEYPALKGLMGNNQTMLLQFPRNYYLFNSLWDSEYKERSKQEVLREVSERLYPDQRDLLVEAFEALGEKDPHKIDGTIARVERLVAGGNAGRSGALGRYLFPDQLILARDLRMQLQIRAARQKLLLALHGRPSVQECSQLLEDYFDKLLAWNKQTGWDKLIDIAIWTIPIYDSDKEFAEAMSRLKQILGVGAPYTRYAQIDAFFDPIRANLLKKYGENSVMLGCVGPFKLAVAQTQ